MTSKITLYPYQENDINEIFRLFELHDTILLQKPTGAGKTVIFSELVKKWLINNPNKKVVICVHRDELLKQTVKSLRRIGISCETVTAKKSALNHLSDVYVCMVETLCNRLEENPLYLINVGLAIDDECHVRLYEKVWKYFSGIKRLGVTATPISNKKITFSKCTRCGAENETPIVCCNVEMFEYTRRFTFSELYDDIVTSVQVKELIELGNLTKDLNYAVGHIDRSKLTIDAKTGDFDTKTSDAEYSTTNALHDVVLNYEELCKGKKTLIFNASIKMNELVFQEFLDRGYAKDQVKIIDSKNKEGGRDYILNWFKETPGAILINAGILVAGFDEETIEGVIMNLSTLSLSKYHQCIGRAGRITDKFYKGHFIHVDLGGNIEYFKSAYGGNGLWSDDVDWRSIFFGTDEKPKPKREALENTIMCSDCGMIHSKSALACPECGFEKIAYQQKQNSSNEVAVLIDDYPLPDGGKIVKYTRKNEKDLGFAYTILISSCADMFIYKYVTRGMYEKSLSDSQFHDKLKNILAKPMRTFVMSFPGSRYRTFDNLLNSIKSKLDTFYKIPKEEIKQITIIKKL